MSGECPSCQQARRFGPSSDASQRAEELRDKLVPMLGDQLFIDAINELCDLVVEAERESLRAWLELEEEEN